MLAHCGSPDGGCAPDPTAFARAFIERVRERRIASGLTQRAMAEALGVSPKNYEAYETRVLLPHRLVRHFARITGVTLDELYRPEPRS